MADALALPDHPTSTTANTTAPSTPTTEPAPPTREAVDQATATLTEMSANLNDPTIPAWDVRRPAWVEKKLQAYNVILASGRKSVTPTGPTPAQILQAKAEAKGLRAELQAMPEGHPDTGLMLARLEELSHVTNHTAFEGPTPGAFTAEDVRKAAPAHWGEVEHIRYETAYHRVGASPMEATMLHHAIRDTTPTDGLESPEAFLRGLWGKDFDVKLAHAERAWNRLRQDEKDALAGYRHSARVMNLIAQIGERLGAAR